MTIYHLVVLAILLIPLFAWAYRSSASSNSSTPLPADLSTSAFTLRALAVLLGFVALCSLTLQHFMQAIVQALMLVSAGLALFGLAWLGLKAFRRNFTSPRRRLFELWLVLLALWLVLVLVNIQMKRIQTGQ